MIATCAEQDLILTRQAACFPASTACTQALAIFPICPAAYNVLALAKPNTYADWMIHHR